MGCLFASRLHRHAHVTLMGQWPEQRALLADPGLEVQETDGTQSHHRLLAVNSVLGVGPVDLVLILVKSPHTAAAGRHAERLLAGPSRLPQGGLALTLQNGLGNREVLAAALGRKRIAQGVTLQAAHGLEAGRIHHAAQGLTSLGADGASREALEAVMELFERANLPAEMNMNVEALQWSKLVANVAINPLTALLQCANGGLLEDPRCRHLLATAAREVADVARSLGLELSFEDPVLWSEQICRATAKNRSSMLQDVSRGATTEIDAICGAVVRAGAQAGVATPVNRLLLEEVKALPNRAAGPWSPAEAEARATLEALRKERAG